MISCHGLRSCAESNITFTNKIDLYGYLSAQNSILIVNNNNTVIQVYGYDSLNGAILICKYTCILKCIESSGCSNATLLCDNEHNNTCTWNVDCSNSLKTEICSDSDELSDEFNGLIFPDLKDNKFSTINNSYKLCNIDNNITNILNCDDYRSNICYNIDNITSNYPICCNGYQSCMSTSNIITNIDFIDYNNTFDLISFRADGYESIDDTSGIINNANGHMYFTSECTNCDSSGTTIENNVLHDIIVSAYEGLVQQTIMNARELFCLGKESCRQSIISNIFGNIYGYGANSLQYSKISNIKGNIYCATSNGCRNMIANNIDGDIVGFSKRSLRLSNLTNISGTIAVKGWQGLRSSNVVNVTNVCICVSNLLQK